MISVRFTVYGQCWSLKNGKMLARGRTIKGPKASAFERDFAMQVPPQYRNLRLGGLKQPLRANISVWYPSRRQDLDTAIIYDCLQRSGVVANDRFIIEHHEWAHVDPINPRVDVEIECL